MIARLTQWQPREGIGLQAALAAWELHASLVARVPGLRRYVQNHAVPAPGAAAGSRVLTAQRAHVAPGRESVVIG
jgi:hypothetical protein